MDELKRIRKIRSAVLLGLALLLTAGWYITYRAGNSSAIRRLEAKAAKRGEPLTLAELAAKSPPIPDAENAAVVLLELWKESEPQFWQAFIDGRAPLPERNVVPVDPDLPILGSNATRPSRVQPLSPAALSAAEDYLKSHAAHMERVRAALRRPRCRFPVKFNDGYDALLPHLSKLKGEAQLFRLEALVATERGDNDAAITALGNPGRIGTLLAEEPFLITQLVRIACFTMVVDGAQHLLCRRELAPSQLARLDTMLDELKLPSSLRWAYIAERAAGLNIYEQSGDALARIASSSDGSNDVKPADYRRLVRVMNAIGLASADRRLMLESFDEAIELADKDSHQDLSRRREIFAEAGRKARRFPPKLFSSFLLPAMQRVPNKYANLEARRRAAVTAVAVQKLRLTQGGKLAEQLDELVPRFLPSVPLDPYDGQPLRYKRRPAGFVVYSIGPDGRDDGGQEGPLGNRVNDYDDTFFVER